MPTRKQKKKIARLKKKLRKGGLTQKQQQNIAARIRKMGGKVALGNFPEATDKAPEVKERPTPPPGSAAAIEEVIRPGLEFGKEFGAEFFAEGALGRLDTERSPEIQELLDLRREQLAGLTPEEERQLREKAEIDANRAAQQARRNLIKRLAQTNQRGAVAAGLLGDIDRERLRAQRGITADVFSENIDRRRQALQAFEQLTTGQQAFERAGQVFNLGQLGAEVAGRAGAAAQGIGLFAGIGQGQKAEAFAQEQFEFAKAEAERIRQQQLEILKQQQKFQQDLFNQSRADAGAF